MKAKWGVVIFKKIFHKKHVGFEIFKTCKKW